MAIPPPSPRIRSGGQTGADRAALDWAIDRGVPHGGWCPKGRKAEDGVIDARYHLTETPTAFYEQRTEWNARDAEGTVIFSVAPVLTGGSALTAAMARRHRRPCLHLSRDAFDSDPARAADALRAFVAVNSVTDLNVAGPRASTEPEVAAWVAAVLDAAFPQED